MSVDLQTLEKTEKKLRVEMNSQFSLSDKTVQSLIKVSESVEQSEEKGKMTSVSCYLCDDVFVDEDSLRIHVENCGKTFHCAKCNGNFKSKRNLEFQKRT